MKNQFAEDNKKLEYDGSGQEANRNGTTDASPAASSESQTHTGDRSDEGSTGTWEATLVEIDDLMVLNTFLQECTDHLENIEEKIIRLEQKNDTELVDEIFRSMHTIKGTSGFFGFQSIMQLSHGLETILTDLRNDSRTMSPTLGDLLLEGSDHIRKMIDDIRSAVTGRDQDDLPFSIPEATKDISALLEKVTSSGSEELAASDRDSDANRVVVELTSEEMSESFQSETLDLLAQVEAQLLELEKGPNDRNIVDRIFRHVHTIKGNAGFLGFDAIERVCANLEDVLDSLRNDSRAASQKIITGLLRTVDALRHSVTGIAAQDDDAPGDGCQFSLEDQCKPLGEILVELGLVAEEAVDEALDEQKRRLGEILVSKGCLSEEGLGRALEQQQKPGGTDRLVSSRKDVRVNVEKLDRLFDLMGELITAQAMVVQNPDLEGLDLQRFSSAANYMGKITRQMQEITMSVRMIPLEGMFNKVRRVVRDLSRRIERPITLTDSGGDTEMDRNVIEALSDPLVHIIRNAVDHGIEPPEGRKAAGKAAEGHIDLSARYEGSEIWISVRDDGRGLDRDKIVARAVEKGLATDSEAQSLSDSAVWQFIFHPGFSTAEQVSDVSGRGVGMDVVRRNIEQLRGKIDVLTTPGTGTEIVLKIPLTLAIIDGVITRVGNILYAIPLIDIREFHQVLPGQIVASTSAGEVLRLRENVIPIVRLREFFKRLQVEDHQGKSVFVVVQSGIERAALLVDEIVGYHQIVVKSLPEYMGHMNGLSGCSVLGNGDVSLIIDTNAIVKGRAA